jgi:medium-chain acyl-[acyl-carrier-protein] hydrolase
VTGVITPWFVRVQATSRPLLRLFCIPYAGVGASAYHRWRGAFAPDIEVLALQAPGRESRLREAALTRIEPLLTAAAAAIRPYLDVPFAVFGHSLGALVAFELVRLLRASEGREPVHLFVSGRRAPHLPPRHPPIADLPDPEFIVELGRRYGGIPAAVMSEPELLALLLPGLKADMGLFEAYRYELREPLGCPISAFGGALDAESSPADLEQWREQTTGAFSVRTFQGGHFFVQTAHAEVVRSIAATLDHNCAAASQW